MTVVIYGEYVFNTIIYADVYFVGIINNNYYIIYLVEYLLVANFILGGRTEFMDHPLRIYRTAIMSA